MTPYLLSRSCHKTLSCRPQFNRLRTLKINKLRFRSAVGFQMLFPLLILSSCVYIFSFLRERTLLLGLCCDDNLRWHPSDNEWTKWASICRPLIYDYFLFSVFFKFIGNSDVAMLLLLLFHFHLCSTSSLEWINASCRLYFACKIISPHTKKRNTEIRLHSRSIRLNKARLVEGFALIANRRKK
jgi:hypothetical protein